MAQSKAESFTAYLEAKQRARKEKESTPAAGGTAFSILAALAGNVGQSRPLPELQAASGLSFATFAEAVKRLQESGYITVTGAPGSEAAHLTPLGADVAALARPA